jgi:uncharacterized protein YutE (UPF0331/DUF86 family)/predicted nucleotidyltransferase
MMAPVEERRLPEIAARHGIRLVVRFGSTVAGPTHARSDVDVGVLLGEPAVSLPQLTEIHAHLQALFPGRVVDLAVLNRADPLFLKKVTDRCRLLHGAPRDLHELRMYAFRRYQDHRRHLALERRYVARRRRRRAVIDAELVRRKMVLILRDLDALRPLASKDRAGYLASPTDEVLAERYLERMIDVNYHRITESGRPPPVDYYASFTELAQLGVLDPEFGRRIAAAAGLRNRIVHEYNELDPARVHEALQLALQDVPTYLRAVEAHLSRAGH